MKNITVSVDEETHRLARIRAAELDTSVSALVRDYLNALVGGPSPQDSAGTSPGETEAERRRRLLREVFASIDTQGIRSHTFGDLTRAEAHDRKRARAEAAVEAWLAEYEGEPHRD